jgi:exosome complex RNA-binding protein Rrp42 (RNase PH superfamily)
MDISPEEKRYIIDGIEANIRVDGRLNEQFRQIFIETEILPHTNGSARVTVNGCINIICSIRVDITEPITSIPNEGIIDVDIEFSPSCLYGIDEKHQIFHLTEVSSILKRFRSNIIAHDYSLPNDECNCIIVS